jgi:hypothetical protein
MRASAEVEPNAAGRAQDAHVIQTIVGYSEATTPPPRLVGRLVETIVLLVTPIVILAAALDNFADTLVSCTFTSPCGLPAGSSLAIDPPVVVLAIAWLVVAGRVS